MCSVGGPTGKMLAVFLSSGLLIEGVSLLAYTRLSEVRPGPGSYLSRPVFMPKRISEFRFHTDMRAKKTNLQNKVFQIEERIQNMAQDFRRMRPETLESRNGAGETKTVASAVQDGVDSKDGI